VEMLALGLSKGQESVVVAISALLVTLWGLRACYEVSDE